MDHFQSLYWICYNIACFMVWFLGSEARGILTAWTGINPHSLHWKAKSQPVDLQQSPQISYLLCSSGFVSSPNTHPHILSLSFPCPSSSHSVSPCSCSASTKSNFLNFSPGFPLKIPPDKVTFLQLPKSRGPLLTRDSSGWVIAKPWDEITCSPTVTLHTGFCRLWK